MMGYNESLAGFYDGGLLVRDFDNHKMHRRMFQTAFKNDTIKLYTEVMNSVIKGNIGTWGNVKNFLFFPHVKTMLLDIAAQTFLGIDDLKDAETKRISDTFEDITQGMIHIDSPLFFWSKCRKGKQAKRYMENYLIEQIPARHASNKMDMFSLICRETDEEGEYFSDTDIAFHINFYCLPLTTQPPLTCLTLCSIRSRHKTCSERISS